MDRHGTIRAIAVGPITSLADFNAWQSIYWSIKQERLECACEQPDVIEEAMENLDRQRKKLDALGITVPFAKQEYLYGPVEEVIRGRRAYAKQFSRSGRRARSIDPLTALIERIVRTCPGITCPELVERLKMHKPVQPVEDVTDEEVIYDKGKACSISALKIRLWRARKKLRG